MKRPLILASLAPLALLLSGCGSSGGDPEAEASTASKPNPWSNEPMEKSKAEKKAEAKAAKLAAKRKAKAGKGSNPWANEAPEEEGKDKKKKKK